MGFQWNSDVHSIMQFRISGASLACLDSDTCCGLCMFHQRRVPPLQRRRLIPTPHPAASAPPLHPDASCKRLWAQIRVSGRPCASLGAQWISDVQLLIRNRTSGTSWTSLDAQWISDVQLALRNRTSGTSWAPLGAQWTSDVQFLIRNRTSGASWSSLDDQRTSDV